ncbi:hypothetical protein C9412_14275 [Stenotrophomonas sp. Nf1]|nr:hypothetical protein C9412_14275 [Stenotrophomonas sp. Nf1]PTA83166.1 hypothetical protein C9416_00835 [Stenotrophomonas sp. Nf4]
MGEGALLAKHCFASARTPSRRRLGRTPEGGSRRPPQPDPPRHPSGNPPLTLTSLRPLRVQGAALRRAPLPERGFLREVSAIG